MGSAGIRCAAGSGGAGAETFVRRRGLWRAGAIRRKVVKLLRCAWHRPAGRKAFPARWMSISGKMKRRCAALIKGRPFLVLSAISPPTRRGWLCLHLVDKYVRRPPRSWLLFKSFPSVCRRTVRLRIFLPRPSVVWALFACDSSKDADLINQGFCLPRGRIDDRQGLRPCCRRESEVKFPRLQGVSPGGMTNAGRGGGCFCGGARHGGWPRS